MLEPRVSIIIVAAFVLILVATVWVFSSIQGLLSVARHDVNNKYIWNSQRLLLMAVIMFSSGQALGLAKSVLENKPRFFWDLFEKALAKCPNFQTAVASMLTTETHEEVMRYILKVG